MKPSLTAGWPSRFRDQHGADRSSQLHALGVRRNMVQCRPITGEGESVACKSVRLVGAGRAQEHELLAICLTARLTAAACPVLRGRRDMPVPSEALQAKAAVRAAAAVCGNPLTRSRLR